MLIASTSVLTMTLNGKGIYPTLLAVVTFSIVAVSIPFKSVYKTHKVALVIAGVISSLICHLLLSNIALFLQ